MPQTPKAPGRSNHSVRSRRRQPEQQQDAPKIEDRLLAAIERLLDDGHRFSALTVEQLAREAGIGRATFYLYFKDKGELVHRLMRKLTAEVADSAGAWFSDSGEVDRHSMRLALQGIVGTFKRHQAVLVAVADTARKDPAVADAHSEMMQTLCGLSRKAVAKTRRSGQATAAAGPALADLLTWIIELYCARFITQYDGRRVDALIDLLAHVCERSIFSDQPADRQAGAQSTSGPS